MYKNILILIAILLFFSCRNTNKIQEKNTTITSTSSTDTIKVKKTKQKSQINYKKTKVLKTVYVINREGIKIRKEASKTSKILLNYKFAKKLYVIEELDKWYKVQFRIRTIKNTLIWTKGYVLKSGTGDLDKLTLIETDLTIVNSLKINPLYSKKDTLINYFLAIQFVSENIFKKKINDSIHFLSDDTLGIKRNKDTLKIKCKNTLLKYINNDTKNSDDLKIYNYFGKISFLDSYLISGRYWEGYDYKLINKNSGKITVFNGFPHISSDKKHLISIYSNPYEETTDLELYEIKNKTIIPILKVSFNQWRPIIGKNNIFWHTNGYFYIAVNHSKKVNLTNQKNENQYIKIKVL